MTRNWSLGKSLPFEGLCRPHARQAPFLLCSRGAVRYGIDDAINAALMLYLDIIQMFVCLLTIFAARD